VLSLFALVIGAAFPTSAHWRVTQSHTHAQFRGISVVSEKVAWLAGSGGTFARTIDGENWQSNQVPDSQKLMFRSVVGFDANHALLLAIGEGEQSSILETQDGGKSWDTAWINTDPKAFYDAMAFWDRQHGIAFSDPVEGRFPLIVTDDGGASWKPLAAKMPASIPGEGAFSASGTCIGVSGTSDVWIATGGGAISRIFRSRDAGKTWSVANCPIPAAKPTSGVFGVTMATPKLGVAVGGDYKTPLKGGSQIAFTRDGGASWKFASLFFPQGLIEAAAFVGNEIVVVGPGGSEVSNDQGRQWSSVSDSPKGMHTCGFSGRTGWAAGDHGLIAKWIPGDKH
jgi:photosystem II stability/assembly factor-like uncharacterized protein